jgi:hypothetical protein
MPGPRALLAAIQPLTPSMCKLSRACPQFPRSLRQARIFPLMTRCSRLAQQQPLASLLQPPNPSKCKCSRACPQFPRSLHQARIIPLMTSCSRLAQQQPLASLLQLLNPSKGSRTRPLLAPKVSQRHPLLREGSPPGKKYRSLLPLNLSAAPCLSLSLRGQRSCEGGSWRKR